MNIVRIYKHISLFSLVTLSKRIFHNIGLIGIFTSKLTDYRYHNILTTIERNLAHASNLRAGEKRCYDLSLTKDETMKLLNIIYAEELAFNDIINTLNELLNKKERHDNFSSFIREKVHKYALCEIPNYPEPRIKNIEKRLRELLKQMRLNIPLNQEKVIYMSEVFKIEFEQSKDLLWDISKLKDEDAMNEMINNLQYIRTSLDDKFTHNNIFLSEGMKINAVLRIRSRVQDILDYHFDKPSSARNN
ncbi:Plasmodium exported protein, unknown function [Plasmodium ovale wallikeri]|uniref:Uncharacterized protein n=2 Tax=Plasmodium ovale TaxID=36330 RepID=A0A1A9AJ70_PLAOA|nr:Plasmodium exported protein, unknown function [Plasmodium ovale wallikeri]SBT56665.1 Plasmodium exported protein, unknown function [Plasmodium ovale wallikeri]SBT79060.1 Plasmodium exported protein, unknown function [Plasmodium ovale]